MSISVPLESTQDSVTQNTVLTALILRVTAFPHGPLVPLVQRQAADRNLGAADEVEDQRAPGDEVEVSVQASVIIDARGSN